MKSSQGEFSLNINGYVLTGTKRGSRWRFECAAWPDLAEEWSGDRGLAGVSEAFMTRALTGTTGAQESAEESHG